MMRVATLTTIFAFLSLVASQGLAQRSNAESPTALKSNQDDELLSETFDKFDPTCFVPKIQNKGTENHDGALWSHGESRKRNDIPDKKPNVILIFTDDHGYADLSCQGVFNDVKTPHIDTLAAGGVRMTNGYVTAPQCVPSRAGILTGQYQNKFGLEANKGNLDGFNNALTIAERLKEAGYATGMSGKWHLGPPPEIPQHGFDDVYYKNSNRAGWANYDLNGIDVDPGPEASDLYHLDANAAAACAFIKRHRDEPFFFYLAFRAPHVPLDATRKYLERFPGEMPERRRKALAMISAVDDGVGSILKSLREYGIEENTLVFFIGDNGAPLKIHKLDAPGNGAGWDGSLNDPLNGEKGTVIELSLIHI